MSAAPVASAVTAGIAAVTATAAETGQPENHQQHQQYRQHDGHGFHGGLLEKQRYVMAEHHKLVRSHIAAGKKIHGRKP